MQRLPLLVSAGVKLTHCAEAQVIHLGEDDGFFGAVDVRTQKQAVEIRVMARRGEGVRAIRCRCARPRNTVGQAASVSARRGSRRGRRPRASRGCLRRRPARLERRAQGTGRAALHQRRPCERAAGLFGQCAASASSCETRRSSSATPTLVRSSSYRPDNRRWVIFPRLALSSSMKEADAKMASEPK